MTQRPKSTAVIVVAAGKGERAGGEPKQFRAMGGEAVLKRTLMAFLGEDSISHVLAVLHPDHAARYGALALSDPRLLPPVIGGATRQASVLEGLKALAPLRPERVLIQDAARPFVTADLIARVSAALDTHDGALPTLPVTDTIKRSIDGAEVASTEDRRQLFAAQTPQGFRFGPIFSAHMRSGTVRREFTDDAEIAEWAGLRVAMVPGDRNNIKITHPEDFVRAERILAGDSLMETRIGTGYDVHPFAPGDAVWLCGVKIPHHAKLQGHSDADVALHALTDAILGAIGEGDIGEHFPPSDPQWKGASSDRFLSHAVGLVAAKGGRILNADVTLVCERPKIRPHREAMRARLAELMGLPLDRVSVKATTTEGMGFTGREEGLLAQAVVSVETPG